MANKENWIKFFLLALEGYRQECPEDQRSNSEILLFMLDSFVKQGLAKKNEVGKYVFPIIDDPQELMRRMSGHRN